MSEQENGETSKSHTFKRVKEYIRSKSSHFNRFPSLQSVPFNTNEQQDSRYGSAISISKLSFRDIDNELRDLQVQVNQLKQHIIDVKKKNDIELKTMTAMLKRDMETVDQFGEQLDDFDQCVQIDKENIHTQMEELEAKIHHQINDQYSDLQEAIEGLYIRIAKLEKDFKEQKQQKDIEEKETAPARNLAVKIINFFLCIAQAVLVVVNTISDTVRPFTTHAANIAIICFILYLIAVLHDDEVGKSARRLFQETLPNLRWWQTG